MKCSPEGQTTPKIVSFLVYWVKVKMMLPLQRELKRQGLSIIKNMSKIDSEKMLPINCVMWSAMAVSMHHSSQNGAKVDLLKSPKLHLVAILSTFGQTCTADKSMTASLVAKVTVATCFACILKTRTTFKSLHLTSTFDLCIGIE